MDFQTTNSGLSFFHNQTGSPESQQSTENDSNYNFNGSQYSNIMKNFTEKNNLYIDIPSRQIICQEAAKLNPSQDSKSKFKKSFDYLKLDVNQKRKSLLFSQNTYSNSEVSTPISLQAEDFISDYQVLQKIPCKKQSQFSKVQTPSPLQKYKIYFWQIPSNKKKHENSVEPIILDLEIADDVVVEKAIKKIVKAFNKFFTENATQYGFSLDNTQADFIQNFEIMPAKKSGKPKEDMPSLDNEQLLSMSGLQTIVLVIKDMLKGIQSEKSHSMEHQKLHIRSTQKRKSTGDRPAQQSVIIEEKSINMIADSYSSNGLLDSKAVFQQNKKKVDIVSSQDMIEQENFCCRLFSLRNLFSSGPQKSKNSSRDSSSATQKANKTCKKQQNLITTTTNFSSFKK